MVSSFEIWEWIVEVDFGIDFSSHDKCRRLRDTLKLDIRVLVGIIRWIISGKYPSDVEIDEYGFFVNREV